MKAISVRAPWWWAILTEGKDIENRSRRTHYRGPVLIHVSTWYHPFLVRQDLRKISQIVGHTTFEDNWLANESARKTFGGQVMGMTNIVDCVERSDSRWFFGPFGYRLEGSRNFLAAERFVVKGQLGLFEVNHA